MKFPKNNPNVPLLKARQQDQRAFRRVCSRAIDFLLRVEEVNPVAWNDKATATEAVAATFRVNKRVATKIVDKFYSMYG